MNGPSHELILGGARSGKSGRAEALAAAWLAAAPDHEACVLATAWAGDAEMAARIARHQADRAARLPRLATREAPLEVAQALAELSQPKRLVVLDCLTVWLSQCLLPPPALAAQAAALASGAEAGLLAALTAAPGPVVLVANEVGLGVMPLTAEARQAVDRLGRLNQHLAAACQRVTLMVAGCALSLKGADR